MLAKKYRLPIQSVLNKSGRSLRSRSFLLKIFTGTADFNRFGVVISKKVDKRAAVRNRIKRIVLDEAKNFIYTGRATHPADVLIIISPNVAKSEKTDIIRELKESLSKAV